MLVLPFSLKSFYLSDVRLINSHPKLVLPFSLKSFHLSDVRLIESHSKLVLQPR